MKFLITGGLGFIGSALIRKIIKDTDHYVLNLDKQTYAANKFNLIYSKNNKNLEKFFKNSNSIAVIVRPDRFILSSCKSIKNFKSYLNKNLPFLA